MNKSKTVCFSNLTCLLLVSLLTGTTAFADEQTFNSPNIKGVQLDWCKHWGAECGRPAADLYCQHNGFTAASSFEIAKSMGGPDKPTLVFGDGRLCSTDSCDGFRFIQCTKPGESTKIKIVPGMVARKPPKSAPAPKDVLSNKGAVTASNRSPQLNVPAELLGGQPSLDYCQVSTCEFTFALDYKANPVARTQAQVFKADYLQVENATAARYEVSTFPIGGALNSRPKNIVLAGQVQNNGVFVVDLIKGRSAAGYLPGSFYVRVIALDKPGGNPVGAASPVRRIYYAENMPPPEPIEFVDPKVLSFDPAPNIALLSFQYSAFYFVENWPPNCKPIPRDEGTHGLEAAGKAWGAVSGVYDAAKGGVIDLASSLTLGYVPKSILELALNTALIAAGIPPEIPDLNKLMSEGAGYFASEMAKMAVSQIPAGELVAATGNLAADIAIEAAAEMTEQQLRDRLEDELRKRTKMAIEQAAKKAEQEMLENASDTYCRLKSYWPTYTVRLKNSGSQTARDILMTVSDESKLFEPKTVNFSLGPGETLTVPLMPDPNVRTVQRSQLPGYDESANRTIWWNEDYKTKKTRITLRHSGATTCVDPLGPVTRSCSTGTVLLLRTPDRGLLNQDRKFK